MDQCAWLRVGDQLVTSWQPANWQRVVVAVMTAVPTAAAIAAAGSASTPAAAEL